MVTESTFQRRLWWGISLLLFAIFVAQLSLLIRLNSDTYDEHAHLFESLRWLETGHYLADGFQSPLPRLAMGFAARSQNLHSTLPWLQQHWDTQDLNSYWTSLRLARVGTLPFAGLLFWTVGIWARGLFGSLPSLAALTALSFEPTILGHASLATLDIAGAAGCTLALWGLWAWLQKQSLIYAAIAGALIGFAQMCKFSAFGFLLVPVVLVLVTLIRALRARFVLQMVFFTVCCIATIWASYGFETGEVRSFRHERATGTSSELRLGKALQGVQTIAPTFWSGFVDMAYLQQQGHPAFLWGEGRETGWWWYFPATLLLKTTPPLLILGIWAGFLALWKPTLRNPAFYFVIAAAGVLLASIPSHVDIGIRHLAPIFPILALLVASLYERVAQQPIARAVVIALLGWQVLEAISVYPNYIAYFTPPAREHDYTYLDDSNLAWGQDRGRLVEWARAHLSLHPYVFGADGNGLWIMSGLANGPANSEWVVLDGNMVAILLSNHRSGDLEQLVRSRPAERIGRSIFVFRRRGAN